MDALKGMFGNFAFGNAGMLLAQILLWSLITIIFFFIFWVAYLWIMYKIKVVVFHVTGSGNSDSPYTISKITRDRVRPLKNGSWVWLWRGFKKTEKFADKYVYPGNRTVAFKVGEKYFGGNIKFSELEDFSVSPVPYDVRRKIELEMQQIDIDLQKIDWWSQGGKQMLIALGFAAIVICFAGFVLWLAFAKTNTQIPVMERLTQSLNSFGVQEGK